MRTVTMTAAALLLSASCAYADPDTLKAARECADRSTECRSYVAEAERRQNAEAAVFSALADLGRAIGLQYNCNGNEAAAMERKAKAEFSAALPGLEADVTSAVDRGIGSVSPAACQPLAVRQAMQRYSDKVAALRR